MTDFATQKLVGPVFSPLISKDKGDFSNRVSCAGEQFKNNVKTLAADTVVIGGTAAGIVATKNKGVANLLSKPVQVLGNVLSKMTKKISFNDTSNSLKDVINNNIVTAGLSNKSAAESAKVFIENGPVLKRSSNLIRKMKFAENLNKNFPGLTNKVKFSTKEVPTIFSKLGNTIKNMPTKYKAMALVVAAGLAALTYIGHKHIYKAGQIDQKYTDKAKLKAKVNETI